MKRNQMQLSKTQKTFSLTFLKLRSNFENYENNMNVIAYVLTKIRTLKDVVRPMSKKFRFRRSFNKQHGKRSQTLLKYA